MSYVEPALLGGQFTAAERAELDRYRHTAGRTSRGTLDLMVAWGLHVEKIDLDRASTVSDPGAWGPHDLVAALFIRDFLEANVLKLPPALHAKVMTFVSGYDERFRSVTQADEEHLVESVAELVVAGRGWWWHRVPDSGPIREELAELGRQTD
jgi:hypothetical protein